MKKIIPTDLFSQFSIFYYFSNLLFYFSSLLFQFKGTPSLSKMFFLFPDPHFKEKNHRRRVISPILLEEYAYAIKPGGVIYTTTDVEELGEWMKSCLENHPIFEALTDEEFEADQVVKLLSSATEEGQKVSRNEGQTFTAVFRRIVPTV